MTYKVVVPPIFSNTWQALPCHMSEPTLGAISSHGITNLFRAGETDPDIISNRAGVLIGPFSSLKVQSPYSYIMFCANCYEVFAFNQFDNITILLIEDFWRSWTNIFIFTELCHIYPKVAIF